MRKVFILLTAVVLTAVSANVFAQGSQQTALINSTRNYWVNSASYGGGDSHTGSTYTWAVYQWDGTTDYTASSWTGTAATGSYSGATDTDYNTQITWLATGFYVVEVVEENSDGCTTVRRFGVTIIDLDLLVVTKDHLGATLSAAGDYCNTDEGNVYGDADDDDLNSTTGVDPALQTMTMTYEITLYTEKGGAAGTEIGAIMPNADWTFTIADNSTIPASPGEVTWTVSDANETTYTVNTNNVFTVPAGTSTVTITAEIQNIATDVATDYVLGFSILPSTVKVDSQPDGVFAEGTEPATYDGVQDTDSHLNAAQVITVHSIPNTTKIKFD